MFDGKIFTFIFNCWGKKSRQAMRQSVNKTKKTNQQSVFQIRILWSLWKFAYYRFLEKFVDHMNNIRIHLKWIDKL